MKDYRIKITIRNERLLYPMESMGYKSVAEFCRFYDLEENYTRGIINGAIPPVGKHGDLRPVVKTFLKILNLSVDDAFTKNQLKGFKKNSFTIKIDETQLLKLTNPIKNQEQKLIEKQVTSALSETLVKYLTPREEKVLRMRFGLGPIKIHTLDEIGEHFLLSRERIRQMVLRAIKKLKNCNVLKHLIKAGAKEYY
jgi:RNA polymerase sigma factor (sigma-70 family)